MKAGGKFDAILEWFKDDKIDISYDEFKEDEVIRFAHPSYLDAMHFAISDGTFTKPGKIFNAILLKLADRPDAFHHVSHAIGFFFDGIDDITRKELFPRLADNINAARELAITLSENFDKLPEKMRNELLLKLVDNKMQRYLLFTL
jgi:hypothetical protein